MPHAFWHACRKRRARQEKGFCHWLSLREVSVAPPGLLSLAHFQRGLSGSPRAAFKPGTKDLHLHFPDGCKGPSTWAVFCHFDKKPYQTLAGKVGVITALLQEFCCLQCLHFHMRAHSSLTAPLLIQMLLEHPGNSGRCSIYLDSCSSHVAELKEAVSRTFGK